MIKNEVKHTIDHIRVVSKHLYAQGFLTQDELSHIIGSSNLLVHANNKKARALGLGSLFEIGELSGSRTGEFSSGSSQQNDTESAPNRFAFPRYD